MMGATNNSAANTSLDEAGPARPIAAVLEQLCRGESIDSGETHAIFTALVQGEVSDIELCALLVAMKAKGESPDEIAGAARALRSAALPFEQPGYAYADSCGTGGDGARTVNISTAVAFVAASLVGVLAVARVLRRVRARWRLALVARGAGFAAGG